MLVVSFLLDAVAAALMIGLIFIQKKYADKESYIDSNFGYLIWAVILMCAVDALMLIAGVQLVGAESMKIMNLAPEDVGWRILETVCSVSLIYFTNVFLYMWIGFLTYRLYHDKGYMERQFWKDIMPLIISGVVTIISIILMLFTDKAIIVLTIAYLIISVVRIFYFGVSLRLLLIYRSQNGNLSFFNVWAFFLPVFAGWLIQEITSISLRGLGSAIGVFLLYISVISERQYIDKECGLYNRKYIDYLRNLAGNNKFNPGSALVFEVGEGADLKAVGDELKKALPESCEPIRCEDKKIVVLTRVQERGPLHMVIEEVKDSLGIEGQSVLINKDETSIGFMERVLR